MKRILLFIISFFFFTIEAAISQPVIENVRTAPHGNNTRIVFDISEPVSYQAFILKSPDRLVVDIPNAKMVVPTSAVSWQSTPVKGLRHSPREGGVRIVLDLHQPLQANSFFMKADQKSGHRLVVDLLGQNAKSSATSSPVVQKTQKPAPTQRVKIPSPLPAAKPAPVSTRKALATTTKNKPFIVAIDAGHGGEDPGAVGARGTREKHVVMAIARELAAEVNKEPGMKAYLTRDGDYFVPLRTRIDKARANQADIFISIHADAFRHPSARGASVFILSEHGASSEAARWIAEQENRVDLMGGVSLDDKDQVLASILIDLSQTASNQASMTLGDSVLNQLDDIAPLHGSKNVQQAGFLVLKSPDIPSILVETEFISNPQAEQKLINKQYQQQIARSIMQGIRQYHRNSAGYHEELTITASAEKPNQPSYSFSPISVAQASSKTESKPLKPTIQTYSVSSGETLSGIAKRFGVTVASIKSFNGLKSDRLYVGQSLKIPG